MTRKTLLKHLNKSEKESIINEVLSLYGKFKNVREFYKAELSEETNPVLEEYKRKITIAYSAANPSERRTNMNVNRMLKEFDKISIFERERIDLMLHRVECGIAAFNRNTKRTATFYNCILTTFSGAVELIGAEISTDEYKLRIDKIIGKSAVGKFKIKERMTEILRKYRINS
jgi:hypothetical protein